MINNNWLSNEIFTGTVQEYFLLVYNSQRPPFSPLADPRQCLIKISVYSGVYFRKFLTRLRRILNFSKPFVWNGQFRCNTVRGWSRIFGSRRTIDQWFQRRREGPGQRWQWDGIFWDPEYRDFGIFISKNPKCLKEFLIFISRDFFSWDIPSICHLWSLSRFFLNL